MGSLNDQEIGLELDGAIRVDKSGNQILDINGVSIVMDRLNSGTGFKPGCINLLDIARATGPRKSRPDFLLPLAMGVVAYHELYHPAETKEEGIYHANTDGD